MASFKKTTLAILLAAVMALPMTLGNPVASKTGHAKASLASVFTPVTEATASPKQPDTAASYPQGPPFVTITVSNHHSNGVFTEHQKAIGTEYPDEVGGMKTPDAMSPRATSEFAVPTGWSGRVAVVEDQPHNAIIGDESLIEANYRIPADDPQHAVFAIDVSYVTGFSLPMTCSCDGAGPVTGCNKDLWYLDTCPAGEDNSQGSCKNPLRDDSNTNTPTNFFLPCKNLAYTYVNDGKAVSFAQCQSGHVSCCIGTDCPAFNGRA